MKLNKYCFKDLIELYFEKNLLREYGVESAIGVNIEKVIKPMKGDTENKDISKFYLVKPNCFVYNPRGSRKLGLGYNNTTNTYITTYNNMIFRIKESAKEVVIPEYLFMYLSRKEWDRKAEFMSWGSSTEVFSWNTFSNLEIYLPNKTIQKKYVDIYKAIIKNQKSYEESLNDLKLTCDSYIENVRKENELSELEKYIERYDERNKDNKIKNVKGVSTLKVFREPTSKVNREKLRSYKIVHPNDISFVQTTHNEKVFANALNNTNEDIVVTSVNEVFKTKNGLLSEYLVMFFNRTEFDRYARFHSWGSARETFTWNDLIKVKIPIPSIEIQQDIVNIYKAYIIRKEINEKLKEKLKELCTILIKGSIEEAKLS